MNHKTDWQAYLDGSLEGDQLAHAEQNLNDDPNARAELDGLKSFIGQLKNQGLSEPVPLDRLKANLNQTVRANRTPWHARPVFWVPAMAAALGILALTFNNPIRSINSYQPLPVAAQEVELRLSEFQAATTIHDPQAAARWANEKTKKPAPVVTFASLPGTTFDGAECGFCWIAYKISYKGDQYTVYGRQERDRYTDELPSSSCDGGTLFHFKGGVGWRGKGNMSYAVKGGTSEGRLAIAESAIMECDNIVDTVKP